MTTTPGLACITLEFSGLSVTLHSSGALVLTELATLIVSDLHLEKASRAAVQGRVLPPFDSLDTLARLEDVISTFRPTRVICLGDSFHDKQAVERMAEADKIRLCNLCRNVAEWLWVAGNHDPQAPDFCGGKPCEELEIEGVMLRHQPSRTIENAQIVGHFHPKTSIFGRGHRVSGRCFSLSERTLILPAFGAYAGGLNCNHAAIVDAHSGAFARQYLLQRGKVWALA